MDLLKHHGNCLSLSRVFAFSSREFISMRFWRWQMSTWANLLTHLLSDNCLQCFLPRRLGHRRRARLHMQTHSSNLDQTAKIQPCEWLMKVFDVHQIFTFSHTISPKRCISNSDSKDNRHSQCIKSKTNPLTFHPPTLFSFHRTSL